MLAQNKWQPVEFQHGEQVVALPAVGHGTFPAHCVGFLLTSGWYRTLTEALNMK